LYQGSICLHSLANLYQKTSLNIPCEKLKIQNIFDQTDEGVKSVMLFGSGNSEKHQTYSSCNESVTAGV
jgi:hypothetical protein